MKDARTLFLKHVVPGAIDDCWPWLGAISDGYGRFELNGKLITAHRAAYLLFVDSSLASKMDVHHACENRVCVNWMRHLEATTRKRHLADLSPTNPAYLNKRKTSCLRGHEYTLENTGRHANGNRFCKTCRREQSKNWKRKGK